jgi:hypothetical protein
LPSTATSHPSRYDWTWAGLSNAIALTSHPVIHGAADLAPHLPHSWPKPIEPVKMNPAAIQSPYKGELYYNEKDDLYKVYDGTSWVPISHAEATEQQVLSSAGIGGAGLSGDLAAPSELEKMMARFDWKSGDYTVVIKRIRPKKHAGFIETCYLPIYESYIEGNYGGGVYDITVRGPHPVNMALNAFLDGCRVKIAGSPKAIKPHIPVSLNGNPVKALPKNYTYTEDASHKETMEALAAQLDGKRRGKLNDPLQQALDKRRGLRPTRVDFVIAASEGIVERRDDGEPVTLNPTTPSRLAIDIDDDEPVDF